MTVTIAHTDANGDLNPAAATAVNALIGAATIFGAGDSGTALTLTYTAARKQQKVTLTGNATITMESIPSGGKLRVYVYTGAGSFTCAFAVSGLGTLRWLGGPAPTVTTTAGKIDVFEFTFTGNEVIGAVVGQNA